MAEINNFIKTIMEKDLAEGKVSEIVTRFPPEPNAYLHIGHARAIINDFELAMAFNGKTNLRFDDTNPVNEGEEYVNAIIDDLKWLGYTPDLVCFGSDYFEKTYEMAVLLIKKGLAYVDDLSQEETTAYRGTLTEPGKNSPYRDRIFDIEKDTSCNARMIDRTRPDGKNSPHIWRTNEFDYLMSLPEEYCFARKFDEKVDMDIVNKIFEKIIKEVDNE